MKTPTDTPFHDIRDVPSVGIGPLLRDPDPRVRHRGLVLLAESLAACPAPGLASGPAPGLAPDGAAGSGSSDLPGRAELAALLPLSVTGPPESALLLAELYERLGPYVPQGRRPAWRTAGLPERVRIAWLRAELHNEPEVLRTEPPGELLYQAVRGLDVTRAHRPRRLLAELVGCGDPGVRADAVRFARQGLHAGLLAPALVRARLTDLARADDPATATAALTELAEPWAALDPLPPGEPAGLLDTDTDAGGPVSEAALLVAARHGHRDPLWRVVAGQDRPPALRRRAMELLGGLAERADIDRLTALAARDPLLLGGAAMTCLRGLHRRGHFPAPPAVPVLVGVALADHAIEPRAFATVLFTCRREVYDALVDAPADAPDWPRRLALLVEVARQGAQELPIGDAITRVLPSAAEPEPFLDALRELRHTGAEEAVIAALPAAPAAALDALEALGGERTVRMLAEGLGLTREAGAETIAPPLRAVRHRALELLWSLNTDPERRRRLLGRLDPTRLPPGIAADLGGPDERELALLRSHLDPAEPVAALLRLAAHGSSGTVPVLTDLLLRVVAERSASWEPGAARAHPEAGRFAGGRPTAPAAEPTVPEEVVDALCALGGRLHARRRIRPVCLLGAADAREAGQALVATMALDLLDRPGLTDGERAILLGLLLAVPSAATRPRVHRLLRHRDRHVRKQVIALLARDDTGDDARALSASLITLTTAPDIQTVRQALLALGHARAHWASPAIAACLDHPNMNIRKTAAGVLARAGAPAAVPALLRHLGRETNPGLRTALVAALRAVLGDAYLATLLAAAERDPEEPCHLRLLTAGLDGVPTARTVTALTGQASPLGPVLLALVTDGRIGLAPDLAADLPPDLAADLPAGLAADPDTGSLLSRGWQDAVALRIAERHEPPAPQLLRALRPMLGDWLRLAGSVPAARERVLRLTLRICPAPWTEHERQAFGRSALTLLAQLADVQQDMDQRGMGRRDTDPRDTDGADRYARDLVAVLEAAVPSQPTLERSAVADAVRALPPAGPGTPSALSLLRACDAVLVRADLDRALAAARLAADPRGAQQAVLHEAFGLRPAGRSETSVPGTAPDGAVRTCAAPDTFRRADGVPRSRDRLAELAARYPDGGAEERAALLDRMTELQPLGTPPWTLAEDAAAPPPAPRTVRGDDLDQPRSAALRARLLALLEDGPEERGNAAAATLLTWPEPDTARTVLRAFLRGRVTVPGATGLHHALTSLARTAEGRAELGGAGIRDDRLLSLARAVTGRELEPLLPVLLDRWEHGSPDARRAAADLLRRVNDDVLAAHLEDRLDAGAHGFADLLAGRAPLRTPALSRVRRQLRAEGHGERADALTLAAGPLRGPDAERRDAAALAALREHPSAGNGPRQSPQSPPSRTELLELARTGAPEPVRRALTRLAEAHTGPRPDPDPELHAVLTELLAHPRAGIRLRAHRVSRAMLDRTAHLRHTELLLRDAQPDIQRMAIRTLCHAVWEPAIPTVVERLAHPHPAVRAAAAEGLTALGARAIPALRHAADHARPDRRSRYTDVLGRITSTGTG
ncbi:HEAT repeat domain-containing protein [Streptomyces sp. NPDC127033]|uniref:HEAT repeat domain-containing protein n=1 Tax=Streptomyces sp. NPDC127033 TaxID=3347110 RepID=UPI00366A549A